MTFPIPALIAATLICGFASGASKPNVIVILADDLGYGDTNCYGAKPEHVKTPGIDRLAKEGLRFTDAHSPAAVCTPSRYSLLTGEYAFRNRKEWGILPGDAPLGIKPGSYTLPEMFRSSGYLTGFVGKWHLGLGDGKATTDWNGEIKPGPLEVGFTSAFFMPATGDRVPTVFLRDRRVENLDPADPIQVNYKQKIGNWPTGTENPEQAGVLCGAKGAGHQGTVTTGVSRMGWMTGGKSALWDDEQLMDRLTGEAVRFITDNREKPFFLYFATHGIHEPRVPAKRFVGKSGAGVYGDQIEELDDSVKRIIQTLEDLKLTDNTLIVFSSDNGGSPQVGQPRGDMTAYNYGERVNLNGHVPNGVLRGGKYNAFEGGTRVPLIVRWPGHIAAGATSEALISHTDLQSSFARLLGVTLPATAAPDSMEILDALTGKSQSGRHELVEHRYGPDLALRVGPWKWINGQLFDLSNDLSETRDLAKEQPERAKAMVARLDEIRAANKTRP
ncbi:MAG TPA: arylsulfatase [Luteolibacter sp.]